ncbi:MAG: hypothetical protein KGI79_00270 [Patescibacteria group bacterium]|nr:hypothetical protein [Patescibacteria group bacterium]MDE2116306.1 hypothetical protein [Patescibacteria group bacterium]
MQNALKAETPLTITNKGAVTDKPEVVSYVRDMLTSLGLAGDFTLVITQKIQSGGRHHLGVEVRHAISAHGVKMNVQYGDNSTRFECFLSGGGLRANQLLELCFSRFAGGHYRQEAEATSTGHEENVILFPPEPTSADQPIEAAASEEPRSIPREGDGLDGRLSDLKAKAERAKIARMLHGQLQADMDRVRSDIREMELLLEEARKALRDLEARSDQEEKTIRELGTAEDDLAVVCRILGIKNEAVPS